jgi:hypothetical protein
MRGVTISDRDASGNLLAFDLRDILDVVRGRQPDLVWSVSGVEALGATQPLDEAAAKGAPIGTEELRRMAERITQTIEGRFVGTRRAQTAAPVVVIRAVDSSCFDVETDDTAILNDLRSRFRRITEYEL